ncbi:MAG: NAD(P)/FAD-dependent oxidoreductase [Alphaproteobacteria bacterium]
MISVKKLPTNVGPAGWNEMIPPQATPKICDAAYKTDFAVIGGGYAGIAAARRLAQLEPNAKIIVLEAQRIGQGPAGRNSGFMIDLPHVLSSHNYGSGLEADKLQIQMNREAIQFALEAKDQLKLPDHVIAQDGKTNAAITEKAYEQNVGFQNHLKALGEASEQLDAQQMREMTGSSFYTSGLYTPGTVMVQPAAYIRALADNLPDHVTVYEASPVVSMERQGSNWLLKTPEGQVSAGRVILATNGHAQSFGFYKQRFVHLILYASLSRLLTQDEICLMGGQSRWGVTPSDPMGSSVRRVDSPDGVRILMRNSASYEPSKVGDVSKVAKLANRHRHSISKRWPKLENLELEYSWGGNLCLSRNDAQAFGEVDTNLISACCQNGLGTSRGTFAGMMAAELALGNTDNVMLNELLKQPMPSKIPPEPFASIGAKSIMAYKQWKARSEL